MAEPFAWMAPPVGLTASMTSTFGVKAVGAGNVRIAFECEPPVSLMLVPAESALVLAQSSAEAVSPASTV